MTTTIAPSASTNNHQLVQCPYCTEQFRTDEETITHGVTKHPGKLITADLYGRKRKSIWANAVTNTNTANNTKTVRLGPIDGKMGLFAVRFDNRGSYIPNLPTGQYGVEHTYIGNALLHTKRIILDYENWPPKSFAIVFGYFLKDFPHGLRTCVLQQPTINGMGPITLLAKDSSLTYDSSGDNGNNVWILSKESLEELVKIFNPSWTPTTDAVAVVASNNGGGK